MSNGSNLYVALDRAGVKILLAAPFIPRLGSHHIRVAPV